MVKVLKSDILQPFAAYPHIFVRKDQYYEASCYLCGGNARVDSPNDYVAHPRRIAAHINITHEVGQTNVNDLLLQGKFRRLEKEAVEAILAGRIKDITPKKVLVNRHGDQAIPVSGRSNRNTKYAVPLDLYGTVIERPDGTHTALSCYLCKGNARCARGTPSRLTFLDGVKGLEGHVRQAHDGKYDHDWIVEHSGRKLSDERFNELKRDMTGSLIAKVLAESGTVSHARIDQQHGRSKMRSRQRKIVVDVDNVEENFRSSNEECSLSSPTSHAHRYAA